MLSHHVWLLTLPHRTLKILSMFVIAQPTGQRKGTESGEDRGERVQKGHRERARDARDEAMRSPGAGVPH